MNKERDLQLIRIGALMVMYCYNVDGQMGKGKKGTIAAIIPEAKKPFISVIENSTENDEVVLTFHDNVTQESINWFNELVSEALKDKCDISKGEGIAFNYQEAERILEILIAMAVTANCECDHEIH